MDGLDLSGAVFIPGIVLLIIAISLSVWISKRARKKALPGQKASVKDHIIIWIMIAAFIIFMAVVH